MVLVIQLDGLNEKLLQLPRDGVPIFPMDFKVTKILADYLKFREISASPC